MSLIELPYCPVCGSGNIDLLPSGGHISAAQCVDCNHHWDHQWPGDQAERPQSIRQVADTEHGQSGA